MEDPTKLFATRAELYPEPTEADAALGAAKATLAAIPILGGTITELLSMVLTPAVSRRKDKWFKELADGLDDLAAKVDGLKVENLQKDEAFVSVTLQAAQAAMRTHQKEKLEALRNAALNSALSQDADEDEQLMFVALTDVFTILHLETVR